MDVIVAPRERFRAYPLDGAVLFFQPATGSHVRVQSARTYPFMRRAPRVVMFGVGNACNLRCSFCSRDESRPSTWTVATAAKMLQELSQAGVLEVAFGGGEPFAFRGFAELVQELYVTTPLALHVTTNGMLLDARSFAPFRDHFGQVRVSIYDDPRWRLGAKVLSEAGQLWGANVLVDARRLASLPSLFAELAALGCHDVSVLRYIGGDAALQLDAAERERLCAFIADAPLACRLSVCFGDTLPIARLFDGADDSGDCGAGYDFLTLTSDSRVQSCSFQEESLPVDTAAEVLAIWRQRQDYLAQASPRLGCARGLRASTRRALPLLSKTDAASGHIDVRQWRAFSGNNSGECILVGKFETRDAARRYLEELEPGYAPDGEYSDEWRALFANEQVQLSSTRDDGETWGQSPSTLIAVGRSVIALGYDAGDAFPELRALTWKRAGFVVAGGIHVHESPSLLAVITGRDETDVRALTKQAGGASQLWSVFPHAELLFVHLPTASRAHDESFAQTALHLEHLAAGRPLGVEVLEEWDPAAFIAAKQRLAVELESRPRLQVLFWGPDATAHAKRFAAGITEGTAHAHQGCILIERVTRRKRLAVLGIRQGGHVTALDSREVDVHGFFWFLEPPRRRGVKAPTPRRLTPDEVARRLSAALGSPVHTESGPSWRSGVSAKVRSAEPARVLAAMAHTAQELGTQLNLNVSEVDPLAFTLRRLVGDVHAS